MQSHEIVSFKFRGNIEKEIQIKMMKDLDHTIELFPGFIKRSYYYSNELDRWIDHIIWSNLNMAQESGKKILEHPEASPIFKLIEDDTMIFTHYEEY